MGSKVISFRFDDDKLALLNQHRVKGESESQTAMRLILGVLGVEGKKPSIQSVDIVDSIRTEIKESLADGDIKDAIASSYEATMGQFNGLLEELQDLKSQLQKLQSNPPAAVPPSPVTNKQSSAKDISNVFPTPAAKKITIEPYSSNRYLPITNPQLPVTAEDVITFLGIADILAGDQYWEDKLNESGINQKIVENVSYLSEKLNIKLSPKGYVIARFNSILDALGYGNKKQGQHTKADGKKQDKYIAVEVTK